jgi:carboxyvinyl-carboxyphosphonate phosphorylmutase
MAFVSTMEARGYGIVPQIPGTNAIHLERKNRLNASTRFRELLGQPGPIIAPGVYDCVSARIVERAGFPAAFISGGAVTASVLGYPDVGLQTLPEILGQSRNIARCVEIPVIVDVDTGYGNAINVMRTVREFEAAGLAGIFFEDQTFPKRCGHFEGKKLISTEEMAIKIKAAASARNSSDFVIVARTDSRADFGLDHAIERALAYVKAGADIIFVEAMLTTDEMRKVAQAISVPLQANLNESSKTPMLPAKTLYEMGYKLISYSSSLQFAAIRTMTNILDVLKREDSTMSAYPEQICSVRERSELLGLQKFYELDEKMYGPIVDSEGSWRHELGAAGEQPDSPNTHHLRI